MNNKQKHDINTIEKVAIIAFEKLNFNRRHFPYFRFRKTLALNICLEY
jgi:hypothetical protein